MKKIVLAVAAAGTLFGGVAVANAQGDISMGFRGNPDAWTGDRYYYGNARADARGFVTVRERQGDQIVVRRIRRH